MHPLLVGAVVLLWAALLVYRGNGLVSFDSHPEAPNPVVAASALPGTRALSAEQMAALDLFGRAKTDQPITATPVEDIPKTKLKLVLKGAFTSSTNEVSSALIATDKRNKARRYFIGDQVPGNALLHQVQANHVVLKRGGRLEKLLFPREQDVTTADAAPVSSRQRAKVVHTENERDTENLKNRLHQLREQLNNNGEKIRL